MTTRQLSHTIVIGAGPAGLAVGACLRRENVPCLLLEQAENVGSAWRRHYERLHLHTAKGLSSLPMVRFPGDFPRYPSRLQVISYLEDYAHRFQLEPVFGQAVTAARHVNGHWEIRTRDAAYEASNLVVATGRNSVPHIPEWPGQRSFRGTVLHSSQYRTGASFRGRNVLVVGFGNSGGEIAIDLWEHGAKPSLAVRSPVNVIPRELFGIPIGAIGILQSRLPPRLADAMNGPILRALMGDLTPYGLRHRPLGPLAQIERDARIPLIDVGTIKLIREGKVAVYPGVGRFTENGVAFVDSRKASFDAVILATGYRAQVDAFLEGASAACDADGTPATSGRESSLPGLYFCGFRVTPTGVLREIALEARRISASIAQRPAATVPSPTAR